MDNLWESSSLWVVLRRTVYLVFGLIILFWFLSTVKVVLVLFWTAFIFTIALNPVVDWLERHGISRLIGTLLTVAAVFIFIAFLFWLVVPRLVAELANLVQQLPSYFSQLSDRLFGWLENYPMIKQQLQTNNLTVQMQQRLSPTVESLLSQFGTYLQIVTDIFVFALTFIGIIIYSLIDPQPLLKFYLSLFPLRLRRQAANAFILGSNATVGWIWASFIIGAIHGISAVIFLFLLGIPGAVIWAVLAFVSQFVPRFGPYIMTIPPALIALSIDPLKAVWVVLFYTATEEITENVVAPYIRAAQMNLHPVLIIFVVLTMVYAFGFLGALIAVPAAGFAKAFYEQFYLTRQARDKKSSLDVERMLKRE